MAVSSCHEDSTAAVAMARNSGMDLDMSIECVLRSLLHYSSQVAVGILIYATSDLYEAVLTISPNRALLLGDLRTSLTRQLIYPLPH